MKSRSRSLHGLAILVIIGVACIAAPASGSFFPNMIFPHPYNYGFPDIPSPGSMTPSGQAINIGMTDDGKNIPAAAGDTIKVTLLETTETWHLANTDNVQLLDDVVMESYPAQHRFTLKVLKPGTVRFSATDNGNGSVVKTFSFNITTDGSQGQNIFRSKLTFDFPAFDWPF